MKKILLFLINILPFLIQAQSASVSGILNSNRNSTIQFSCNVDYKLHKVGTYSERPQGIKFRIRDFQILDVISNNLKASNISSISLPKNCDDVIGKLSGRVTISEGQLTWSSSFIQSHIGSIGDFTDHYDFSSSDLAEINRTFGKGVNADNLNIKISKVEYYDDTPSVSNCASSIRNQISDFLQKKKDIEKLKNKISSYGSTKEDLLKKQSIYKELAKLDKEDDYKSELDRVEKEMESLAIKQIRNEVNAPFQKESSNDDFEKIKRNEKERIENNKTTQELISSYPEIRKSMDFYKSIGDWKNYNENKKIADYIRDYLLPKQQAKEELENELSQSVADVVELIDIREPDFQNNRLVFNYSVNDFNEVNFGFSHRSVWGNFFWQMDFMANALYFDGWKFEKSFPNNERNALINNIEENDIAWFDYEEIIDSSGDEMTTHRLYRSEKIFSIGGGLNSGFGFFIPTKKGNLVISALGLGRLRSKSIASYGYKLGAEFQFRSFGVGLHYKNSTFSNLDNDDIIITKQEEDFRKRTLRRSFDDEEINYFRAAVSPNDYDQNQKNTGLEISIFINL